MPLGYTDLWTHPNVQSHVYSDSHPADVDISKSVISHQRYKFFNTNDPSGKDARFQNLDFGLSRAVRAGNLVFLQGQTGLTFDGNFVGKGDPAAQADSAMCQKAPRGGRRKDARYM